MKHFLLPVLLVFSIVGIAQNRYGIGSWKDHLCYENLIDVCEGEPNMYYAATPASLFSYSKFSGEIQRMSKLNLLSDVRISAIEYEESKKMLIVGYENGNLDLIFNDERTVNIPDIKISSIIGDKKIYNILPYNNLIYLATGLGIVVIDPVRAEVKESYQIGPNGSQAAVYDIAFFDGKIYASLTDNVLYADITNPILANFANWTSMENLPESLIGITNIEFVVDQMLILVKGETQDIIYKRDLANNGWLIFLEYPGLFFRNMVFRNNQLVVSGSYTVVRFDQFLGQIDDVTTVNGIQVYPNMAIGDRNGEIWIADSENGLMRTNLVVQDIIAPNGPHHADAKQIDAYNDHVWIAHGGVTGYYGNQFNIRNISYNIDDEWKTIANPPGTNSDFPGTLDIISVSIDPTDNNHVYMGSWEDGLMEFQNGEMVNAFNSTNSPLQIAGFSWTDEWIGVAGIDFDLNGTAWYTNSFTPNALQARDKEGNFYTFNLSPTVTASSIVTDIVAAQTGLIWMVLRGRGLLVYNTNGTLETTSDDQFKLLTEQEGQGNLINNDVYSIKEDLDGEIWIGTLQGLSVLYNQEAVFTSDQFDAETILIEQGGNIQELLATETITAIEIDGGNRKWISTANSGVYLFSDDGVTQIEHFTVDNSPLLTNNVIDMAINQRTGEVFFITEMGVISYFGDATNFDQEIKEVRAFPNPVYDNYEGLITIDGLAYNTIVKITDLQGNILFETSSEGGRATWDGKDFNGQKPATGVYLIFAISEGGESANVGKIAIIK